jgi:hypothetical protein
MRLLVFLLFLRKIFDWGYGVKDSPIYPNFEDDASKIANSSRWSALNEKIISLTSNCDAGNGWQVQLFAALCYQVFSEYRRLKEAFEAEVVDPSQMAWRARNLLELSVWSIFFTKSRANAWRLYEDAGQDAMNIFDEFQRWGQSSGQQADWLSNINIGKSELAIRAANEGIDSLDGKYMRVEGAAEICGLKDMFKIENKTLSKFAHPTAMQILGTADDEKQRLQRDTFYSKGCCYFLGAFNALESCAPLIRERLTA